MCDARTLDHVDAATILAAATHVLWVMPATASACKHAEILLGGGALPPVRARETLVAISTQPAGGARVRDLRTLASHRQDQLVLVPHVAQLPRASQAEADGRATAMLTQLATVLRR